MAVLHAHGAIIGGEYPQHLITIYGMDKIKVQELWGGKLEEYRKFSIARKVKVTPSGVLTMGVVTGQTQLNN